MSGKSCLPLARWLTEETEGECRSCGLAILLRDYQDELSAIGRKDLENFLHQALTDPDDPILKIAESMDYIKGQVPRDIGERLQAKDCEVQQITREGR